MQSLGSMPDMPEQEREPPDLDEEAGEKSWDCDICWPY